MAPRAQDGEPPAAIGGWTFVMWPDFERRWQALVAAVERQRRDDPEHWAASPAARLLRALVLVIEERIARDPNAPEYRLRDALKAWRRVKFLGRYRLFYRFSSAHRVVVLAWLNDENTLRKEGAATDPYAVFGAMLARGEVPGGWEALSARARPLRPPLPDARRS